MGGINICFSELLLPVTSSPMSGPHILVTYFSTPALKHSFPLSPPFQGSSTQQQTRHFAHYQHPVCRRGAPLSLNVSTPSPSNSLKMKFLNVPTGWSTGVSRVCPTACSCGVRSRVPCAVCWAGDHCLVSWNAAVCVCGLKSFVGFPRSARGDANRNSLS